MTAQLPNSHHASFLPNSFEDPAFEPQAGFDLDDANDKTLRNLQNNFALNGFHGGEHGFPMMTDTSGNGAYGNFFAGAEGLYPVGSNSFSPTEGTFHIDPSSVWSQSTGSPMAVDTFGGQQQSAYLAGPFQSAIVQKRTVTIALQFGRITPPEESLGVKSGTPSEEEQVAPLAKMDKSQRARNAAIQRHAKTKKAREARQVSKQDRDLDNSGDNVIDKRKKYQEKNRLAAAKCRMKKKRNVETLEDRHRRLQADNSFLKRKERELRDELTIWRTLALKHNQQIPSCHCQPLRLYNSRKASEVAHRWGAAPVVSLPSDTIDSTVASPGNVHATSQHQSLSSGPPSQPMSMMSLLQSFAEPSDCPFAPVTTADSVQMSATAGVPEHFSNSLHNSVAGGVDFS